MCEEVDPSGEVGCEVEFEGFSGSFEGFDVGFSVVREVVFDSDEFFEVPVLLHEIEQY